MSFKLKISLLLILSIVISAAVPVLSIYHLSQKQELQERTQRNLDNFIAINAIKSSFISYDNHINRFLLTRNPNWWQEAKAVKVSMDKYYKTLILNSRQNDEFKKTLKEIRRKQLSYFSKVSRLVKWRYKDWNTLTAIYNKDVVVVYNGINSLITSKAQLLQDNIKSLTEEQEQSVTLLMVLESILVPFIIFLAVVIFKSSVNPINEITKKVKHVRADEPESIKNMVNELDSFVKTRKVQDEFSNLARTLRHLGKEIEEKTSELNQLIITDEKTKLFNFRHFKEEFTLEFARARRFNEPLSLIMIDIDKFKHYNDTNGHLLGDEVLIKAAKLLKQECRETDIPARFGGEEFAALLPRTDSQEAFQVAERIRKTIEESVFPNQDKQPSGNLTASLGVATYPYDASDVEALINSADEALYEAKEKGRNQVVAFVNLQS